MGYVFTTHNQKMICIDSGIADNTPGRTDDETIDLYNYITSNARVINGKYIIDAWFFTHGHTDHVSAFNKIVENYSDEIVIKSVYYNFPSFSYSFWNTDTGTSQNDRDTVQNFLNKVAQLKKNGTIVFDNVLAGDVFTFGELTFKILFSVDTSITENAINNSSLVIKVLTPNKSVLFLGDIGKEVESILLNDNYAYKLDLKSDIVQVAHHGWNGTSTALYDYIEPDIILYPASSYLYVDTFRDIDTIKKWAGENGKFIYTASDGADILTTEFKK